MEPIYIVLICVAAVMIISNLFQIIFIMHERNFFGIMGWLLILTLIEILAVPFCWMFLLVWDEEPAAIFHNELTDERKEKLLTLGFIESPKGSNHQHIPYSGLEYWDSRKRRIIIVRDEISSYDGKKHSRVLIFGGKNEKVKYILHRIEAIFTDKPEQKL